MKKYALMILVAVVMMACNQGKLEGLSEANQHLMTENQKMDSVINDFIQTLNEVEENLAVIREKEELINQKTTNELETGTNAKEEVINDIQAINTLLDDNRKKMDMLRVDLKNSNLKIKEFDRMVNRLRREVKNKDGDIAQMKGELEKLNFENEALNKTVVSLNYKVDTLESVNGIQVAVIDKQKEVIAEKTTHINTAYYVTGSSKQLTEDQIVKKNGGILGLGSTEQLANNIASDKFNRIDITQTMMIPILSRKAELVTSHPEGSYKLVIDTESKQVASLEIIDPEVFWKASKYLVVLTN